MFKIFFDSFRGALIYEMSSYTRTSWGFEGGSKLSPCYPYKDIKHGWTPLHIAIVSKQYESAKFLIRAGSSVSECDKWGNSAQKLFELSGI